MKKLYSIYFHHDEMSRAISQNLAYIASGGWGKQVNIKKIKNNQKELAYNHETVMCMCFSKNGRYVASGGQDCQVVICDIVKKILYNYYHSATITKIFLSDNGDFIASGDSSGCIVLYSFKEKKVYFLYQPKICNKQQANNKKCTIWTIDLSFDNNLVAFGGSSNQVSVYSINSINSKNQASKKICSYYHANYVNSVAFSKNCNFIASGDFDNEVIVWNIKKNKKASSYSHKNIVTCVKFLDGTDIVISSSKYGEFILYDTRLKKKIETFQCNDKFDIFDNFFFSLDGKKIVSEITSEINNKMNIYQTPTKIHILLKKYCSKNFMRSNLKKCLQKNILADIKIKVS